MAGVDVGLTYFLRQYQLTFDTNFSFYKSTEYYNSLTKKNDPINAPKFKMNATIAWSSKFGDIGIKYKHVDQYVWKDGIWSGIIGPYDLYDLLYNYDLTEHVNLNITIQNIFNKVHKEMVGGPALGRQMIVRLTTSI
jgi:outer membrane receptor protein involved in Fe transport